MKRLLAVALVGIGFFVCTYNGFAQDQTPKYTAQQIYDFFSQYTPQDVVDYANEAIKFLEKTAIQATDLPKEKEEELMGKALDNFYSSPSKFNWKNYPFVPSIVVQRCDEGRIVAHPVPAFFSTMSQKGFINKYKDIKGKKAGAQLCNEIKKTTKGVWIIQYQWWPLTDSPLQMGFLMKRIPDSPYEIQSFYPTTNYTENQLNGYSN